MKSKKGFTLIELLAVIVILAIIALITVPQVLGMTTSSRNQANMRSLEGHIRNMENQLVSEKLATRKVTGKYDFDDLEFENYPQKDQIRCEEYDVKDNAITEAKNCVINDKKYCYLNNKAVECDELEKTLKNRILSDNTVLSEKADDEKYNVDDLGLYKSYDTNSGSPTYYFKGGVTNNYVKFADKIWRVVRINEDGTIRLILEDAINGDGYYMNIDATKAYYSDGLNSSKNARYVVEEWYKANIANNTEYESKIAQGNYFCERMVPGMKYYMDNPGSSVAANASFRCDVDDNGYQYVDSSVGLISFDEATYAEIRDLANQTETDYLRKNYFIATMNATITYLDDNYARYYMIPDVTHNVIGKATFSYGLVNVVDVRFRPVINLKSNVMATKEYDEGLAKNIYVVE